MLPPHVIAQPNLIPNVATRLKYWRGQLIIIAFALSAETMLTAFQLHLAVVAYLVTSMLCWLSLVWPLSCLNFSVVVSAFAGIALELILFLMSVLHRESHPVIRGLVRGLGVATLYLVGYISHRTYKIMYLLERLENNHQLQEERQQQLVRIRRQLERNNFH